MNLWQSVRVALSSLGSNKLRTFLTMLGIIGYVVSMGISGWIEGAAWEAGGSPQTTMLDRYPYHVARAVSGLIVMAGQFLFVWNVYKTVNYPISLSTISPDDLQKTGVTS